MNRFALLAALLLPVTAFAEESVDCANADTQLEINECANLEFETADKTLNATYAQVTAMLKGQPVALTKLRNAQRLWIQLRDADIEARYPVGKDEDPRFLYGSMYPMLYSQAKTQLTQQRTEWLRATFIDREEGDL